MLTYVNLNMYCALSVVSDFVTPWTVAHQAPLFMEILQTRILVWVAMSQGQGAQESCRLPQPGTTHKTTTLGK